jgi:RNase P subunit RPR2
MIDPKTCMHFINFLTVRARGRRRSENDRSPPPRVEVECTACGWTGWYNMDEKFRKPKVGEEIEYDCGCSYRIDKVVRGAPMAVSVVTWCQEHDPTIDRGEEE